MLSIVFGVVYFQIDPAANELELCPRTTMNPMASFIPLKNSIKLKLK